MLYIAVAMNCISHQLILGKTCYSYYPA